MPEDSGDSLELTILMHSRRHLLLGAYVGLAALKLWLAQGLPVFAIGPARVDDQLYISLADHIIRGQWLGPYNELTLARGAFYPIWIAANFFVGLPLTFSQQFAYAVGCWLVTRALHPLLRSGGAGLLIFAALLWNPMSYEMPVLGRIGRHGIYTPLSLAVFAAAIALFMRMDRPDKKLWPWAMLGGFSLGAFWITREEGLWAVPALLILAFATVRKAWRSQQIRLFAQATAVAVICGVTPIFSVCWLNWTHYGWFGTIEFRAPQFLHAYGALCRLKPILPLPLVPVTHETRLRLYALSPAFAELQPYLEGETGRMAAAASAPYLDRSPVEMEISGGQFIWALRESVAKAGHCQNAHAALEYYDRLAHEIDSLCDRGIVDALPPRANMTPVWRPEYFQLLLNRFVRFSDYEASFRDFKTGPMKSYGSIEQLVLFRDVTRSKLAPWADGTEPVYPLQAGLDETKRQILQSIGKTLRRVYFTVVLFGLLAWLALGAQSIRQHHPREFFIIGAALLAGIFTLVTILALIEISSFPTQNPGYFGETYPLAILFGFGSCYAIWREFRRRQAPRQAQTGFIHIIRRRI